MRGLGRLGAAGGGAGGGDGGGGGGGTRQKIQKSKQAQAFQFCKMLLAGKHRSCFFLSNAAETSCCFFLFLLFLNEDHFKTDDTTGNIHTRLISTWEMIRHFFCLICAEWANRQRRLEPVGNVFQASDWPKVQQLTCNWPITILHAVNSWGFFSNQEVLCGCN